MGPDGEEHGMGGLGQAWGPVGGHGKLEIQAGVWMAGDTPTPGYQSDEPLC